MRGAQGVKIGSGGAFFGAHRGGAAEGVIRGGREGEGWMVY